VPWLTISQLSAELVKKGAVLSAILYCVYVDYLLLILSKAGVGWFIGLHFLWAHLHTRMTSFYRYIGTIPLLRCIRSSLYEDYACEYSISFNARKPKYLAALPKNCRNTFKKVNGCNFYIDGRMIDIVQSFLTLAIWSHKIRMTAKILLSGNIIL